MSLVLPPGQRFIDSFPRFGLSRFADRFPHNPELLALSVGGLVKTKLALSSELENLPRVEQVSDFHCVTTWSHRSLQWSGFRFRDFYEHIVLPQATPDPEATLILIRGQDGYRSTLLLEDLLAEDVLLADRLAHEPLSVEHGAPLRLVAPAHYGYKNVKHISRIEFLKPGTPHKTAGPKFMDHPRARVHLEERGRGVSGWVYRFMYRPFVHPTINRFHRAMENFTR